MNVATKGKWSETTLGAVAEKIAMGPFGSNIKIETFVDEGVPVISGAHLRGTRLKDTDYNFVSSEHADRLVSANVRRGDVVFTHAGNIGQVAYIPKNSKFERYILSQRQFYLRPSKRLSAEYLTYYFHSPQGRHQLFTYASQVGVPSIAQPVSNLKSTPIVLPPIEEQQAIVAVISSLDDKIDLLQQESETLEQIAQTIFNEWFVKPTIDSALPEGWKEGTVSDVISILSGFAFRSSDFDIDGQYKLATIRNVQDGHFVQQTTNQLSALPSKMPSYCLLKTGDTLLSLTGNVGRVCYVVGENYLLNQRVAKIEPKNEKDFAYAYFFFRQPVLLKTLERIASGTAQQNLSPIQTGALKMIVPHRRILDAFADVADPLVKKMHRNSSSMKTLEYIRDALLPRLMSGEVRVIS